MRNFEPLIRMSLIWLQKLVIIQKLNVNAGNIGLFQALGGAYLKMVFNSTHFKDVSMIATNRAASLESSKRVAW